MTRSYIIGLPVAITVDGDKVHLSVDAAEITKEMWEETATAEDANYTDDEKQADERVIDEAYRRNTITAGVMHQEEWEAAEFMGELAPFTPMLDLLLPNEKIDDAEVWEMGRLLLLVLDRNKGTALGVADYVGEGWDVVLYYNHPVSPRFQRSSADNFLNVTESIGSVVAGSTPEDQQEVARRILWYLNSEQYQTDVQTLSLRQPRRYEATHASIHDGSPAMLVTQDAETITLVNEDGFQWTDPLADWRPIPATEHGQDADLGGGDEE